jgi:hypothetical protein
MLTHWFKIRDMPTWPKDHFPKNGFIVGTDTADIAAGFIFATDCAVAWFGFPVTNPEFNKEIRYSALEFLMEVIAKRAKSLGYKLLFTTTAHPGLADLFKRCDFVLGDRDVTQYVKHVGGE